MAGDGVNSGGGIKFFFEVQKVGIEKKLRNTEWVSNKYFFSSTVGVEKLSRLVEWAAKYFVQVSRENIFCKKSFDSSPRS